MPDMNVPQKAFLIHHSKRKYPEVKKFYIDDFFWATHKTRVTLKHNLGSVVAFTYTDKMDELLRPTVYNNYFKDKSNWLINPLTIDTHPFWLGYYETTGSRRRCVAPNNHFIFGVSCEDIEQAIVGRFSACLVPNTYQHD